MVKPLKVIQLGWVLLAYLVAANTIVMVWIAEVPRITIWIEALPIITGLVALMGTAAGVGPLVSKKLGSSIEVEKEKEI